MQLALPKTDSNPVDISTSLTNYFVANTLITIVGYHDATESIDVINSHVSITRITQF